MIPAKTWYKIYNNEFLAIMESFKIWRHYLKSCKQKVLVFIDYNKFWQFMDTKSLSFCLVHWAQELSCYYFQIDYHHDKVNKVANALFCFFQKSLNEKEKLWAKNTWILYYLQFFLHFRFQHHVLKLFAPVSGFNLQNLYFAPIPVFLELILNQTSQWRTLLSWYW